MQPSAVSTSRIEPVACKHVLLPLDGRVLLIGMGKAAAKMAEVAAELLGPALSAGVLVTKYGHAAGARLPGCLRVIEAGHPVPDENGLAGAVAIKELLKDVRPADLVLVLVSGGASALTPLPVPPISLADLQHITELLLRSGATINELNTVRKHIDRLKGGGLARLAAPARLAALILSDVVGDPLDVIASGPTVPDASTYQDAWQIMERYGLLAGAPPAILSHLSAGCKGQQPDTPKPGDPLFERTANVLVGSNRQAAYEALAEAARLGYAGLLLSTFMEGEAREIGKLAAALGRSLVQQNDPLAPPACLVLGGETTVTMTSAGKGGRNQELALSAAHGLAGLSGVALMALATDGSDGPTDAAGAIVDGATLEKIRRQRRDPADDLRQHNSYLALQAAGSLMFTGPTGTNVNDLIVILAAAA
jgi:hydroxypyruvate reductase